MADIVKEIEKRLFELQDTEYKAFHSKLMPTVSPDTIIGVRTPVLRKLAKELSKHPEIKDFLNNLPHKYYEENNLHGFIIEAIKDYDTVIAELDKFLPYVDNWATCDLMSPKILKKHTDELLEKINIWINSQATYTIRFGIKMLMSFYLDEHFKPEYLTLVSEIKSEEYYVKMMTAWYFATALAKQYENTLPYIEEKKLSQWTHNKAIQKAVESNRIPQNTKEYLKTLKV